MLACQQVICSCCRAAAAPTYCRSACWHCMAKRLPPHGHVQHHGLHVVWTECSHAAMLASAIAACVREALHTVHGKLRTPTTCTTQPHHGAACKSGSTHNDPGNNECVAIL